MFLILTKKSPISSSLIPGTLTFAFGHICPGLSGGCILLHCGQVSPIIPSCVAVAAVAGGLYAGGGVLLAGCTGLITASG